MTGPYEMGELGDCHLRLAVARAAGDVGRRREQGFERRTFRSPQWTVGGFREPASSRAVRIVPRAGRKRPVAKRRSKLPRRNRTSDPCGAFVVLRSKYSQDSGRY